MSFNVDFILFRWPCTAWWVRTDARTQDRVCYCTYGNPTWRLYQPTISTSAVGGYWLFYLTSYVTCIFIGYYYGRTQDKGCCCTYGNPIWRLYQPITSTSAVGLPILTHINLSCLGTFWVLNIPGYFYFAYWYQLFASNLSKKDNYELHFYFFFLNYSQKCCL